MNNKMSGVFNFFFISNCFSKINIINQGVVAF